MGKKDTSLAFNLFYFLENISLSQKWKQIKIQYSIAIDRYSKNWISYLWESSSLDLIEGYKRKNLLIKYSNQTNSSWCEESLIITRIK